MRKILFALALEMTNSWESRSTQRFNLPIKPWGTHVYRMAASFIVAMSEQAALIIGAVIGVAFAMHR